MFKTKDYFTQLNNFEHKELFEDIENPWEVLPKIFLYLKDYLAGVTGKKIKGEVEKGVVLASDDIYIGEGTVVESGVYIKGPAVIGKNCEIRSGAYIRGNAVIGDECVVGHGVEVKNSIFLDKANAAHFNYVGDSVLGSKVNLGAGSILANFRFDGGEVKVGGEGTGLNKFGAILGDGVQIGCNSVTSPGTLIEKGGWLMPTTNLKSGVYSIKDLKNLKS